MKAILLSILVIIIVSCNDTSKSKGEVIVLGTVHFPTEQVNSDSIYKIIEKVNPDIIVMEADSSVFNADFSFKKTYDENEYNAVVKYVKTKPEIMVRPMEFEGRDAYRKKIGIYPEAGFIFNVLWEIVDAEDLPENDLELMYHYENLWAVIEVYKKEHLRNINQPEVDRLIDSINEYQYKKVKRLIDTRNEFNQRILDAKKDTITMRSYFNKWSEFEEVKRNQAMASNLLATIRKYPNKKIIALTGFKHRSAILKSLKLQQDSLNFRVKEYYEM